MEEKEESQQQKRSYVKRMYDSVMDMKPSDRAELIEKLEDVAIDEAIAISKESEGAMLSDYGEEIEKHSKNFGKKVGLLSGIEVIDDMTMGMAPGELIIVAGPTSAFKTGLCLNMGACIAKQGKFVGFISLEMTKPEIGTRLNVILGEDKDYLDFFYVNKSDSMSWKSVERFLKKAIEDAGIEILFIDHLHYFARSMENQATELGLITQEFKKLAIKYKIPIVLISHTRKTDNNGIERSATMNDLRGSSFIAQDADIVLMVNKVREGDKFASDRTSITLNKNRNRFGVDIGTEWRIRRNGLRIEPRLSYEERPSWGKNFPDNSRNSSFTASQSASNSQSSISYRPEQNKGLVEPLRASDGIQEKVKDNKNVQEGLFEVEF